VEADAYEPINELKPLADGVWIVDGAVIRMRYPVGGSAPFPTRITVLRLADGGLALYSPTEAAEDLVEAIRALCEVRALVAPNRAHWWFLGDWQEIFPEAATLAAPGVAEAVAAGAGIGRGAGPARPPRIGRTLTAAEEPAWAGAIDHLLVESRFMTEAMLFHHRSATRVVTDLIENLEPSKVRGPAARLLLRLLGAAWPDGGTQRGLRATFSRAQRRAMAAARERMIEWAPARIVLAHGAIVEAGAVERLRAAFAWAGRP
jgi:hypothetical protein